MATIQVSKKESFEWNEVTSYEDWIKNLADAVKIYKELKRYKSKPHREIFKRISAELNDYGLEKAKSASFAGKHTAKILQKYLHELKIEKYGTFGKLSKQSFLYVVQDKALITYDSLKFETHLASENVKEGTDQESKRQVEVISKSMDEKDKQIQKLKEDLAEAVKKHNEANDMLSFEQNQNMDAKKLRLRVLNQVEEIAQLKEENKNLNGNLDEAQEDLKNLKTELKQKDDEIDKKTQAITNLQNRLSKVEESWDVSKKHEKELEKALKDKENALPKESELNKSFSDQEIKIVQVKENEKNKKRIKELEQEVNKFKTENKDLKSILSSLRKLFINLFSSDVKAGNYNLKINNGHVDTINQVLNFDQPKPVITDFMDIFFTPKPKPNAKVKQEPTKEEEVDSDSEIRAVASIQQK